MQSKFIEIAQPLFLMWLQRTFAISFLLLTADVMMEYQKVCKGLEVSRNAPQAGYTSDSHSRDRTGTAPVQEIAH